MYSYIVSLCFCTIFRFIYTFECKRPCIKYIPNIYHCKFVIFVSLLVVILVMSQSGVLSCDQLVI